MVVQAGARRDPRQEYFRRENPGTGHSGRFDPHHAVSAVIQECIDFGARVQSFELQIKDGNDWKTFCQGGSIGKKLEVKFDPINARIVRLSLNSVKGPSIYEFDVFAPVANKAVP